MWSRNVPPGRSKATASARGVCVRSNESSMEAKPCSAFVTRPSEVLMSVVSAKNARKASDIPSNSNNGRWSGGSSANEVTLQDLLGNVAHARSASHRGLLDDLEGRRFVKAPLFHQHLLGALDDLASLDLVVDDVHHLGHGRRPESRRAEQRGQFGQQFTAAKRLHEIRHHPGVTSALDERTLAEGGEQHDHGARALQL